MVVQSGGEPVSRSVIARAYRESPRKALPVDAGLPPKTASSRSRQPPWTDAVAGHYQRPAIPVAQLDRHVAVREAELQCWVAQEWRRSWNRTPGKPAGLLTLNRPSGALAADDIAQAVMFALTQPPHGT